MSFRSKLLSILKNEETRAGYFFMLPAFIFFPLFMIYPLIYALYLSFTRGYMSEAFRFVGIENYIHALASYDFWSVMKNTAFYSIGSVMIGIILGLLLAVLLASSIQFRDLWRTIFYFPVITPWIIVSLVWRWILHPQVGVLNFLFSVINVGPFQYLSDASLAMPIVILIGVWKQLGYYMLIYITGLLGIPKSYYEAADIDGANSFQTFFKITLPLLKPTTLFLIVTSVIATFQVFGQIYVMTAGGPGNATTVIVYKIYNEAFINLRMGYASALSYIMFVLLAIITVLQFRFLGKDVEY